MESYGEQAKWAGVATVINHFFNVALAPLVLSVYIGLGNSLSVSQAFTAMVYIGMALHPMRQLPHFYNSYNEFKVSIQRIEKFLKIEEVEKDSMVGQGSQLSNYSVEIDNHSFSWGVKKDDEGSDDEKKEEKTKKK